ncbi:MAG: maltose alpha-D-glucosyltransferase [Pseudomonadota bacterium]
MAFLDDPLWYKDAIIYELHVKAFFDASGDGIGDFRGLIEKLDYLEDLGVNTLWLLPFYPSPMRDDGYDIADYRNIHPDYGSRQDMRALLREAHRRDMRIITELVINHTSDQHPWFQAARRAPPGSAKRNYYVWSDTPDRFPETRIIFTDTEDSNWAWDRQAQAYYWHRFFSHQPDLNFDNPSVVKAVIRTMRFWLDMGVDGFRLDAIPYLIERDGTNNENLPETHAVIKRIRAELDAHYAGRMLLAEANQWPEDVREYFGEGDECHMAYHFPLMPRMYMALAQEDRYPIVDILRQTPVIPETCQWALFLRNHDELTLEMVTDRERDYMYQTYAADPRMRVNVGIRRRLAPLLDNDRDKIQMLNCLLMSMPGTPIIYYGDEIGMGDNFYLGDRNGVRTPMQWSPDRNAGFSRADPQRLYLPPVMDAIYGYQAVNVEAQSRNPSSLLNWMRRLIAVRRNHPAFGRGELRLLAPGNRKILAYLRSHGDKDILCVANLSHAPQAVELNLADFRGRVPVELNSRTTFPPIGELPYLLTLQRYGFLWFLLSRDAPAPVWHTERPSPEELPILVLTEARGFFLRRAEGAAFEELVAPQAARSLEQEILPRYFKAQRWFPGPGAWTGHLEFKAWGGWQTDGMRWLFSYLRVSRDAEQGEDYFLPLAMKWGVDAREVPLEWLPNLITRVRRRAELGVLLDAMGDDDFCRMMVEAMGKTQEIALPGGRLRFESMPSWGAWVGQPAPAWEVSRPSLKQSHTSVVLGERLLLKIFRRLQAGPHPEWDMGRFLTDFTAFDRTPPLLGGLVYQPEGGEAIQLALLHGYLDNQGTAWDYTLSHLGRTVEELASSVTPDHSSYAALARTLGLRLGELHRALSTPTSNPAFGLESVSAEDVRGWVDGVRQRLARTLEVLGTASEGFQSEGMQAQARELIACQDRLDSMLAGFDFSGLHAAISRYHGDFHLWRVLMVQGDVFITGLQGPPAPDAAGRRARHSPLRDVAGLLCSLELAARQARMQAPNESPPSTALIEQGLSNWLETARQAFLAGYREGIADCASVPGDPRQAGQLIRLFMLEQRLRELDETLALSGADIPKALDALDATIRSSAQPQEVNPP